MLAKIGLAADAGIGCVGGSVSLIAFPCALRLRVTSLRLPAPVISRGKIGGWGWRHIHRYESEPVILGPSLRIERSEEHTSELQSLMRLSYAVFCLKKKKQ